MQQPAGSGAHEAQRGNRGPAPSAGSAVPRRLRRHRVSPLHQVLDSPDLAALRAQSLAPAQLLGNAAPIGLIELAVHERALHLARYIVFSSHRTILILLALSRLAERGASSSRRSLSVARARQSRLITVPIGPVRIS